MHWGWYWKIKRWDYVSKETCENYESLELDSFSMFNDYERQVQSVRESPDKQALHIPKYKLKAYLQDNDDLLVVYHKGSYIIPVERMPCHFGGYYYFFHCPKCDKRMRKLYCLDGQYLCRKCGDLAYRSQSLRPSDRLYIQQSKKITRKIRKLGGNLYRKPPRMHYKTFQAYLDRNDYLKAKRLLADFKDARNWYGFKVSTVSHKYLEREAGYTIEDYKKLYPSKKISKHSPKKS